MDDWREGDKKMENDRNGTANEGQDGREIMMVLREINGKSWMAEQREKSYVGGYKWWSDKERKENPSWGGVEWGREITNGEEVFGWKHEQDGKKNKGQKKRKGRRQTKQPASMESRKRKEDGQQKLNGKNVTSLFYAFCFATKSRYLKTSVFFSCSFSQIPVSLASSSSPFSPCISLFQTLPFSLSLFLHYDIKLSPVQGLVPTDCSRSTGCLFDLTGEHLTVSLFFFWSNTEPVKLIQGIMLPFDWLPLHRCPAGRQGQTRGMKGMEKICKHCDDKEHGGSVILLHCTHSDLAFDFWFNRIFKIIKQMKMSYPKLLYPQYFLALYVDPATANKQFL